MQHWEVIHTEQRGGFTVEISKTWEDCHPGDLFDTSTDPATGEPYWDIDQMCRDIDAGRLDWFQLCANVRVEGVLLGSAALGGLLYEDARETLKDGIAEDLILDAMAEAQGRLTHLAQKFTMLTIKHSHT